jgi:hypothetical protein
VYCANNPHDLFIALIDLPVLFFCPPCYASNQHATSLNAPGIGHRVL